MGWRRAWFSWVVLGLVACSGSSPPAAPGGGSGGQIIIPPPTGGTGGQGAGGSAGMAGSGGDQGTGGVGGLAGSGGSAGTGGMAGAGGSGIGEGNCDNPTDTTALNALLQASTNARRIAHDCGANTCTVGDGETVFKQCATECVEDAVDAVSDLSPECAACYGNLAWDARESCNETCAPNSCSTSCQQCGQYPDWMATLTECAGRTSLDCGDDT